MMDMSFLSQPRVAVQVPNPIESMSKVVGLRNAMLEGQDIASQTQQRQASAQKDLQAQQKQQRMAQILQDVTIDPATGMPDMKSPSMQQLFREFPDTHAALSEHYLKTASDALTLKEKQKALDDEKAYYQDYLSRNNLEPSAFNEVKARAEMKNIGAKPEFAPAGSTIVPVDTTAQPSGAPLVTLPPAATGDFEKVHLPAAAARLGKVYDPTYKAPNAMTPQQVQAEEVSYKQQNPDEYNQKLAAFNSDPLLVKKFGPGPNGLAAKEQADRVATSAAQGAAATQRANGNDERLANVAPSVHKEVLADVKKANDEYITAQQAADDMKTFVNAVRSGNKQASAYIDTEGVLTLNTGRGVKRVNGAEIASYAGAGSLYDRIVGAIKKEGTGVSKSDSVINDIEKLHQLITGNATTAYQRKIGSIIQTYRSDFQPIDFSGAGASAGGGSPFVKPGGALEKLLK